MIFPSSARYGKAVSVAHKFLQENNITNFPLNPFSIIKDYQWGLIKYTELSRIHSVGIKQIIKSFQSEDGFTEYDGVNYTIAYNDNVKSEGRIRFTLMHEIGHILLNHFVDFDETILLRSSLTKEKYEVLERETNVFARNALSPAVIVNSLKLKTKIDIMHHFKISNLAAQIRLNYLSLDFKNTPVPVTDSLLSQFEGFIFNILNSNYCNLCGYFFISKIANYCPICGNNVLVKKGRRKVIYDGFELDDKGHALICPKCNNEETNLGKYCIICGANLVNVCAGTEIYDNGHEDYREGCGTIAPGNARYCYKCGNETTFYQSGILKEWDKLTESEKVIPPVNYDDTPF